MLTSRPTTIVVLALCAAAITEAQTASRVTSLPRTANGKPDLQGIWQAAGSAGADLQDHAARFNMLAGRSVVTGGQIPYQPWAAAKKAENFRTRQQTDPLRQCYMAGTPRMMYLDYPFQIFQTPSAIAIAFEWSLVYRLIYTDGSQHADDGLDSWMGDSRGRWEGDTLVVDVTKQNDKTWFDMAGDFHTAELHVIERYRMTDRDTIRYEATIEDPKVFTRPWTITVLLRRRTDRDRLFEYVCQAEAEEENGAFTREERTWYPGNGTRPAGMTAVSTSSAPAPKAFAAFRRTPQGKPDFQGFYVPDAGGGNYGLEVHTGDGLTPGGRGIIIDPPDAKLPMQPWAVQEKIDRNLPERGYDDPTAHCFPAGVPRSMYVPTAFHLIQTPEYIVFLHERISWRIIRLDGGRLDGEPPLPDSIRLWQGDSRGRWDGDTLVVETTNLNGKAWLNEAGEIVSYAAHVTERFTPTGPDTVQYEATTTDPVVYTRPWTIALALNRQKFELGEGACHEEDHDLPHLKAIRDAAVKRK